MAVFLEVTMKKIFSMILLILLCFSVTSCAADYEIKWFEPDLKIVYAGNNSLIIKRNGLMNLSDSDGKLLLDDWYSYLIPFEEGIDRYRAVAYELYFPYELPENDFNSSIIKSGYRMVDEPEKYSKMLEFFKENNLSIAEDGVLTAYITDYYDINGRRLYGFDEYGNNIDNHLFSYEIINAKRDKNGLYGLIDKNGDVTQNKYKEYIRHTTFPSYFTLVNDTETIVGNNITGEFIVSDGVFKYINYPHEGLGVIAKKDDKYIYYTKELKPASELMFDEYVGEMGNSVSFKKDGIKYVFDNEGKLAYSGEKDIKAAFYEFYVMEEDGKLGLYDEEYNNVIPPVYNRITPYCNNVWIAETSDDIHIYNGSKLKLTGVESINGNDVFEVKGYLRIEKKKDEKTYIYDTELNEIASFEGYVLKTNGYVLFVQGIEDGKTGRVIFKDNEPNVLIDGKLLVSDTISRIKNDITLIPLRAFAERTGFEVEYLENTKEIKLASDGKEIIFKIGEKTAKANGKEIFLEAAPEIINNRTLVPVRAVSDVFGYDISWDGEKRVVRIKTN